MRLLCLSDLHLRSEAVVAAIDRNRLSPFLGKIAATVAEVSPDAVVVGDIGEKPSFPPMLLYFRLKCSDFQWIISASDMHDCGRLEADIFPKSSEWQLGIASNPIPSAVFPDENGGSHTHPSFLPAS